MSRAADDNRRQELFEAAQRLASVGGWEYELDGERLYWTDEVRCIHDCEPGYEPTLSEAIEFYHPADRPAVRAAIETAIEDGEAFESDWRIETAAGDQRWLRVHGEPHRESGSTVRVRGAVVDITARNEHQTRLNTLFETGRELLESDSVDDIAGLAAESSREVLGLSINAVYLYDADCEQLVPASTTESATDIIGEPPTFEAGEGVAWTAFERGEPQRYDDVRTAADVHNPDTPIRSELAVPLGDHGVLLVGSTDLGGIDDRTFSLAKILAADVETALDQLARETELRETSERLETILQHTPDALFVLDDSGRIVDLNDQAAASLGDDGDDPADRSALLGSHWSEIGTVTDGSQAPPTADPLAALRESPDSVITVEGRHTRQDGSTFPVRVRIARIDHDQAGGFLALARDISELSAQQRQLRQQNEQLEQFASVISHDLRSPLSVAQAGVEVARRTGEGHGDSLDRASRAHERMKTLVENLLRLARNGQTMDESDLEPVELSAVVHRSWQTVATEDAELSVDGECQLVADESRLRQLVENLLRNAVDHGGDELIVTVGTLSDGFYIEDTGEGIAEADREQIFEPGYTTDDDGTGYGLEIVRTVAEAHGWEITVTDSTAGGARFEITGVDGSLSSP